MDVCLIREPESIAQYRGKKEGPSHTRLFGISYIRAGMSPKGVDEQSCPIRCPFVFTHKLPNHTTLPVNRGTSPIYRALDLGMTSYILLGRIRSYCDSKPDISSRLSHFNVTFCVNAYGW